MIKLIEIYEDEVLEPRNHHSSHQDDYTKLKTRYSLREVFLNPEYITLIRCEASYSQKLNRGLLVVEEGNKKLNSRQEFSKVNYISGNMTREIIAVISAEELVRRVNNGKTLLKG